MQPAPPASASSAANRSTPYRSTGFQYVMTSTGLPVAACASRTVRSTSAMRDAAAQRDVVGGLDDRAVQHRVAVRQPDLDDVAAALEHAP